MERDNASRPAVSRHLKILRESKLVINRRSGREWRYALDGQRLVAVYVDWFEQFAPVWDEALRNLQARAESGRPPSR